MEATIKELTKKNIAKRLNIPHYFSSGSPYVNGIIKPAFLHKKQSCVYG